MYKLIFNFLKCTKNHDFYQIIVILAHRNAACRTICVLIIILYYIVIHRFVQRIFSRPSLKDASKYMHFRSLYKDSMDIKLCIFFFFFSNFAVATLILKNNLCEWYSNCQWPNEFWTLYRVSIDLSPSSKHV